MRRRIINDWFGGRLRLPPELIDTPDYDPKPGPDAKMLAGQNQMPASMVRKFPPWMRDIIRSTPDYPKAEKPGTHQFDPRDVPIIPIDPAGNRAFDPMFGRGDETLMAGGDQRSLMLNYLNSLMGMPGGAGDDQTKMLRPIMGLIQALAGGQT
jgi:hypothetical protein